MKLDIFVDPYAANLLAVLFCLLAIFFVGYLALAMKLLKESLVRILAERIMYVRKLRRMWPCLLPHVP